MRQFARHNIQSKQVTPHDIGRLQDSIEETLKEYTDKPHNDSWLLGDIELTAGIQNWIEHGLNREIRGWQIVDKNAAAIIWRVSSSDADLSLYLPLATTVNCTVGIVVF